MVLIKKETRFSSHEVTLSRCKPTIDKYWLRIFLVSSGYLVMKIFMFLFYKYPMCVCMDTVMFLLLQKIVNANNCLARHWMLDYS